MLYIFIYSQISACDYNLLHLTSGRNDIVVDGKKVSEVSGAALDRKFTPWDNVDQL